MKKVMAIPLARPEARGLHLAFSSLLIIFIKKAQTDFSQNM